MISLHFKEELETIKNDFVKQFNKQIKELIANLADVIEEPEELPMHPGMLDPKVKLAGYLPRQRIKRLFVLEYEELKRRMR